MVPKLQEFLQQYALEDNTDVLPYKPQDIGELYLVIQWLARELTNFPRGIRRKNQSTNYRSRAAHWGNPPVSLPIKGRTHLRRIPVHL